MGMKKGQKQYGKEFTVQVMIMHYHEGKSCREIADYFNLPNKKVIGNIIMREHARQKREVKGITQKRKGRPRIKPLSTIEQLEAENKRLQMENDLLKKFHEELRR